jgi:hypothetical protein
MRYHVIVTGSRPEKVGNKFVAMPEVNVEFIERTLARVAAKDFVALYHGAAAGVDTVVDEYAFTNGIHVKQFPAYWFDPANASQGEKYINKGAGLFRNEAMIRQAITNAHDKADEQVVLLAFYNTPTIEESRGTNHAFSYAVKKGLNAQQFQLPVLKGLTLEAGVSAGAQTAPF